MKINFDNWFGPPRMTRLAKSCYNQDKAINHFILFFAYKNLK